MVGDQYCVGSIPTVIPGPASLRVDIGAQDRLHAGDVALAAGLEELDRLVVEPQMNRLPGPGQDQLRARPVGLEVALVLVQGDRALEVGLGRPHTRWRAM